MWYIGFMRKVLENNKKTSFPVVLEKDEDGVYIVECPVFQGCYSEGKTIDEALKNIREVIELCLEDMPKKKQKSLYFPTELSLHNITI